MTPKAYEFHPLAQEYPLIDGLDAAAMEADMRECGFDSTFPVVLFEGKILDGRGRYTVARKVGIEPLFVQWEPAGPNDTPAAFVARANENRRPLDAAWLTERRTQRRAKRIEQVAELRKNGDSLRVIAQRTGVSEMQVRRDLEEFDAKTPNAKTLENIDNSGATPPVAPEIKKPAKAEPTDGKVTGKDGKKQSATKKPKAAKADPQPDHIVDAEPTDALGNPVPKIVRDTFNNQTIAEAIAAVETLIAAVAPVKTLARSLKGKAKFFPFILLGDLYKFVEEADTASSLLLNVLQSGQPYVVCPACQGAGCDDCRKGGYLPEWRYQELQGVTE